MSIRRSFDATVGVLVLDLDDEITISEMMNQVLLWFQDPDFSTSTPILVDFNKANWMPMYQQYEQVPDAVFNKILEHRPIGRVAFVLRTATERVMMSLINKTRDWPMEWGYFAQREEALAWLTENAHTAPET